MYFKVFKLRPDVDTLAICKKANALAAHVYGRECFIVVSRKTDGKGLRLISVEREEYLSTRASPAAHSIIEPSALKTLTWAQRHKLMLLGINP